MRISNQPSDAALFTDFYLGVWLPWKALSTRLNALLTDSPEIIKALIIFFRRVFFFFLILYTTLN